MKKCLLLLVFCGGLCSLSSFGPKPAKNRAAFTAYLFVYFEGSGPAEKQEQLRYAISRDGINWKALNQNQPIVSSDTVSSSGGIRDPHIIRREDGKGYFLVATDMNTVKYGWDSNPGITLMKTTDLIHWSASVIDFSKAFPEKFAHVKWVWAPQTIYDTKKKKYLVYFTIRYKNSEDLDFYAAYANKDFTGFESTPTLLFHSKYGAIDGDIIYKDGLYHFFYKGHTRNEKGEIIESGIQQATSKNILGPWKEDFIYIDAYSSKKIGVEGSGIFQLNNGGGYVLMYDLYTSKRYEFQRSQDLFKFSKNPESFTKDFNPRHGTVMNITEKEWTTLSKL